MICLGMANLWAPQPLTDTYMYSSDITFYACIMGIIVCYCYCQYYLIRSRLFSWVNQNALLSIKYRRLC